MATTIKEEDMALDRKQLAGLMKKIDTCMLCTVSEGEIATRPMSNNKDVEFDETTWFFTNASSRTVSDLAGNDRVMIAYQGERGLWISVQGRGTVHRDKDLFAEHWDPDIDRWFSGGIDDPDLALIQVDATRVSYWTYEHGDGTIEL